MSLPNVLVIHCHDLGDFIGCYPGNDAVTPALDRFAADGTVFDQHFAVAPTCSPSRACMHSGLLPHRNGLMGLASGGHMEIDPETPTLGRLFAGAGYATASFGIWHINVDRSVHGIEVVDPESACESVADNAIGWLRGRDDRPFFALCGFFEPHRRYTDRWPHRPSPDALTPPGWLEDHPEVREELSLFYGDVSRVDAAAGRIFDFLAEAGLEDETLVVFTTDHGIAMPLGKGTLYDPGIKIAMVMRWPGRVPAGRHVEALTSNLDLLPTLLEAVGLANVTPVGLDGTSLWPHLTAGANAPHEHVIACQTWHDFYEPMRAIRTQRHKLIRNYETGPGWQIAGDILHSPTVEAMRETLLAWERPAVELYDLEADPFERQNLAGRSAWAEIEAQLRETLEERLRAGSDPILDGIVPAPVGYWEHFMAKPRGPGGLPLPRDDGNWLTIRWPFGAQEHHCSVFDRLAREKKT